MKLKQEQDSKKTIMGMLSFRKGCRTCNQSNGITSFIGDYENNIDYYKSQTDHQVSGEITKSLEKNNINCEFCGERNFDISNIRFDDIEIFKLSEIKNSAKKNNTFVYIYNMTKQNNLGGASIDDVYQDYDQFQQFQLLCLEEIQSQINNYPQSNLKHHPDGIFYACFTGSGSNLRIEKLRYSGFSKEALLNISSNIGKNPFED